MYLVVKPGGIDHERLNSELKALGLPDFTGTMYTTRRQVDGVWTRGNNPYAVFVKCSEVGVSVEALIRATIGQHTS